MPLCHPLPICNPILDRQPKVAVRDPALIYESGVFRCFHTAVEKVGDRHMLFLDVIESPDLVK